MQPLVIPDFFQFSSQFLFKFQRKCIVGYEIVVCIKQVPDTENLTSEAMKEDGTVNRSALPAIVNPEDLHALEMALQVRDECGGSVTVITMGPPSAAEALRQMLYRGADKTILLTDRKFAASDTLATSYILSQAIRQLDGVELVFCGRQAIDGDTAQIGPQLAEKLGFGQITYAEDIQEINDSKIVVKRGINRGYEVVRSPLPVLVTVTESANTPRPPAVKRMLKYKNAKAPCELDEEAASKDGCEILQWSAEDIGCDVERCGGSGSPTKVKKIESVKLVSKEHERIPATEEGLSRLVANLISEHILE